MKRMLHAVLCLGLAVAGTGCAVCQSPFDATYAAYGGIWQRQDRVSGRVGSALSGTGMMVPGPGEMETSAIEADLFPSGELYPEADQYESEEYLESEELPVPDSEMDPAPQREDPGEAPGGSFPLEKVTEPPTSRF